MEVVIEWPAEGIGETRTTLDGDSIAAAAARCRPLWPDDARLPSHEIFALKILEAIGETTSSRTREGPRAH